MKILAATWLGLVALVVLLVLFAYWDTVWLVTGIVLATAAALVVVALFGFISLNAWLIMMGDVG